VPRVRVGVDETRERRLTGKAFRHFEIGRLARETRNAPGGVDEEREATLELISCVNAVGEPTEFARNGGDFGRRGRRRCEGASKRGRAVTITIAVAPGSLIQTRAGSAAGTRATMRSVSTIRVGRGRTATVAGLVGILQGHQHKRGRVAVNAVGDASCGAGRRGGFPTARIFGQRLEAAASSGGGCEKRRAREFRLARHHALVGAGIAIAPADRQLADRAQAALDTPEIAGVGVASPHRKKYGPSGFLGRRFSPTITSSAFRRAPAKFGCVCSSGVTCGKSFITASRPSAS